MSPCKTYGIWYLSIALLIFLVHILNARPQVTEDHQSIEKINSIFKKVKAKDEPFEPSSVNNDNPNNNNQKHSFKATAGTINELVDEGESIPPFLYLTECQRKSPEINNVKEEGDAKEDNEYTETIIDVEQELEDENNESEDTTTISSIGGDSVNYFDQDSPLSLPDCSEKNRGAILFVSTLDGYITGIDYHNGDVLWSHITGSEGAAMLSSSMSKMEVTSRGEWVRLIPSLDGGIYRFDGENVEALPVTAETLLHSSYKLNDETIFTGGKSSEILGIVPDSGSIKYTCNAQGCQNAQSATAESYNTLLVKRITQTVRAIDPVTGAERWNFSVGLHELNLSGGGCESAYMEDDGNIMGNSETLVKFVLPEGTVRGMDRNKAIKWQQKLSAPIVDVWELINGKLEKVDLFSSGSIPALTPNKNDGVGDSVDGTSSLKEASMYVGINNQQFYVKLNQKFAEKTNPINQPSYFEGRKFPKVQWQPYLATAVSRTPVVHHSHQKHPLLLDFEKKQHSSDLVVRHNLDYPYDNGFYLFGDDIGELNDSDSWARINNDGFYFEDESVIGQFPDRFWRLFYYLGLEDWQGVLLVVCVYSLFHMVIWRYLFFVVRTADFIRAGAIVNTIMHNIMRENPQILLVIQRMGLNIQRLPPPPPPDPDQVAVESNSPNQSEGNTEQNFSSRYLTDFEPIQCLGKGGFGVVFHMKNKLDENEYAVKRIALPLKESSSNRVKREARALAKLNHSNIVRYYNSWLETPPSGWRERADHWWNNGDMSSSLRSPETTDVHAPIGSKPMSRFPLSSLSATSPNDSLDIVFQDSDSKCDNDLSVTDDSSLVNESTSSSSDSSELPSTCEDDNLQDCGYSPYIKEDSDSLDISFRNSCSGVRGADAACNDSVFNQEKSAGDEVGLVSSHLNEICDSDKVPCKPGLERIPRSFLYIQMELCKKESLKDWLSNNRIRDSVQVFAMFNDILQAVEYIHDHHLIHRDLKPSNIFFSLNGEVKVGDFGLVTTIEDDSASNDTIGLRQSKFEQRTLEVGTQLYMSPEQITGNGYDYKIDIFSLGLIFFEMLEPFGTEMERRTVLLKVRDRNLDQGFTKKFINETELLQSMLHADPVRRPTTRGVRASASLQHLQTDLGSILPEQHFALCRTRTRNSSSFSESNSNASTSNM